MRPRECRRNDVRAGQIDRLAGAEEQARAYRTADRDELHVAIAQATFHLVVFVERLERGVHFLFVRGLMRFRWLLHIRHNISDSSRHPLHIAFAHRKLFDGLKRADGVDAVEHRD